MRGAADEAPGEEPGDVIVVLQQLDHPTFERSGNDIIIEKKISLAEALLGFSFELKHLNNKMLHVKSPSNKVLAHGESLAVEGHGMPVRNSKKKGGLFVKLNVEMPKTLTQEQKEVMY